MRPDPYRLRVLLNCFAAFLFFPGGALHAQTSDLKFEHLSVEQGLSYPRVFAMVQDHRNFMWFGTGDGLNRYDGQHFIVYRHDPFDSNSISGNYINSVYEDKAGSLWVDANGQLNMFDRLTERFTHVLKHDYVTALCEDTSGTGTMWFATEAGGLGVFDRSTRTFKTYRRDAPNIGGLSSDSLLSLLQDRAGTIWIGTVNGLDSFDKTTERFTYYTDGPKTHVNVIFEDPRGQGVQLWIGTSNGLYSYDRSGRFFTHCQNDDGSLKRNDIRTIYEDTTGALWIGTEGGLAQVDRLTGVITNYNDDTVFTEGEEFRVGAIQEDPGGNLWLLGPGTTLRRFDRSRRTFTYERSDDANRLVYYNAISMYKDRVGTMWFGTAGSGTIRIDKAQKPFIYYAGDSRDPKSLSFKAVTGTVEDRDGVLWVATAVGLNRLDSAAGTFTRYNHDPKNPRSLSYPTIWAILEDRRGTLWLGTRGGGLESFEKAKGIFRHHRHEPANLNSLSNDEIWSVCEDRSGTLWIGMDGVLDEFNPRTGTFVHHKHDPHNPGTLSDGNIYAILEDASGIVWIGSAGGGLNRFDRATGRFTHFVNDPGRPNSLSSNGVTAIYEDHNGVLWVGTWVGLNRFDKATESFTVYLSTDVIGGILEDDHGFLWLRTIKGISKFDPGTGAARNYDASDGVKNGQAYSTTGYRNRRGEMFFGGLNGLIRFHPDSIKDNLYVPPVVLTSFRKFETQVQLDSAISEKRMIELSYKDNVISFEFAALSYTSPEKNQYAYQLVGFDTGWVYCGTRRTATYTNLDGGDYIFKVKGSNNDGVWNEEGTSIAVIITPPLWKTKWAYVSYFVLIAGALYAIRRYQINRIAARHRLELSQVEAKTLREVDEMKSRFFANISHEFRTPLTLILGPIEKWRAKASEEELRKDLGLMERNARRLLRLINQLLDLSKIEAHGMKLQAASGNIVPFVAGIVQSFQSSAGRRGIALNVEAGEEEIELYFDRDKMEKILTNLLSNAFKFTVDGGEVKTRVHRRAGSRPGLAADGWIEIAVADTGIGIPGDELPHVFDRFYQVDSSQTREQEGSGIGLALTKELVELHGGTISVKSEVGKGTEFTVCFPLGKEHLKREEIVDIPEGPRPSVDRDEDTVPGELENVALELSGEHSPERPLVLIVEDNADVRTYIREYLVPKYRVLEAREGAEGVEKARESIPDLIISDVMMPKMDGYELCKTLKLDEKTSHVPIILLTAKAGQENKIEGLETGADDYLTKPFDAKELLARVKNLIELRQKLRERFSAGQVLKPGEIAVTSIDDAFLQKVMRVVENRLGNEAFSVEDLAYEAGMSRSQLHRKLTALTGQSPSDFVRYMRLHRAMEMLKKNAGTVSEVAYAVGFNSVSYFTKCFREQFGALPSEVKKNVIGDPSGSF